MRGKPATHLEGASQVQSARLGRSERSDREAHERARKARSAFPLLVGEGEGGALRAALARLRDDRDLWRRLAAAGRERVLAEFTHAQVAQKTYRVYCEMLGG